MWRQIRASALGSKLSHCKGLSYNLGFFPSDLGLCRLHTLFACLSAAAAPSQIPLLSSVPITCVSCFRVNQGHDGHLQPQCPLFRGAGIRKTFLATSPEKFSKPVATADIHGESRGSLRRHPHRPQVTELSKGYHGAQRWLV